MEIDSGADALRSQFLPDNRRETMTGAHCLVPRKVETPWAYWRSVDLGNSDVQFATFLLRQPLLTQHTLRWIEEAIEVIGSETPDDDGFVRLLEKSWRITAQYPQTDISPESPDHSPTGVNIRYFPAFQQDRGEVRTPTITLGSSATLGGPFEPVSAGLIL